MIKARILFLSLTVIGLLAFTSIENDDWTHFRGSNLDAIAHVENCPVSWSSDVNIAWKTKIHGRGWSSPVVQDDQIWMTTATEDGTEMFAVCVDFNNGEMLHDIKLFEPDSVYRKHQINSYATPTMHGARAGLCTFWHLRNGLPEYK
jgi:outer membrane protein assembly factor BamB